MRVSHAHSDIATTENRSDRDVGTAALANHACAIQGAVFADADVRTGVSANGEVVHADGQGGHVADVVFGRLHTERQDGAVT